MKLIKDYKSIYDLPEHWILDPDSHFGIDYKGYTSLAVDMIPSDIETLLDVGCGDGYITKLLVDKIPNVNGVDYNEKAINFARLLVTEAEFNCLDITSDPKDFILGKEIYDVVILIEVIEHIQPDYHITVLKNIYNSLKARGKLLISVPTKVLPLNKWHYKHFEEKEIVDLLLIAGFGIKKIIYQNKKSFLSNPRFWRYISNKYYDFKIVRRLLKSYFLRYLNLVQPSDKLKAGRFLILTEKN